MIHEKQGLKVTIEKCYCKSGLAFSECCEPILRVLEVAPTALSLMRSRYAAYCLGDVNYSLNMYNQA